MDKKIICVIVVMIVINSLDVISCETEEQCLNNFDKDPTTANFNTLQNPTAEDLSKVMNPTYDNFNRLGDDDKAKYLEDGEFIADKRSFANKYFSESKNNINNHKETFSKYLTAEGVDVKGFKGDITSFSKDGTLTGSDASSININDFRSGGAKSNYAVSVNNDGKIMLTDKSSGKDIEFTGQLKVGNTGNFEISGPGSINENRFSDGKNIKIDGDGNIQGEFDSFKGINFKGKTPLTYSDEDNTITLKDAKIKKVDSDADVKIEGNNIDLPMSIKNVDLTLNSGSIGFNNGISYVPAGSSATFGNMMSIDSKKDTSLGFGNAYPIKDNVIQFSDQMTLKGGDYSVQLLKSNPYFAISDNGYFNIDMNGGSISIDSKSERVNTGEGQLVKILDIEKGGSIDITNGRAINQYSLNEEGKIIFDTQIDNSLRVKNGAVADIDLQDGGLIRFNDRGTPYVLEDDNSGLEQENLKLGDKKYQLDQNKVYVLGYKGGAAADALTTFGEDTLKKQMGHSGLLYYDTTDPDKPKWVVAESAGGPVQISDYRYNSFSGHNDLSVNQIDDNLIDRNKLQKYTKDMEGTEYTLFGRWSTTIGAAISDKDTTYCSDFVERAVKASTPGGSGLNNDFGVYSSDVSSVDNVWANTVKFVMGYTIPEEVSGQNALTTSVSPISS